MVALHEIWSDGILFAIVGSAVVSAVLMMVCLIAGLCPCEKTEKSAEPAGESVSDAAEPVLHTGYVDMGWMRAA